MVQQIGETRDAIVEDMNKRLDAILKANSHKTKPYYVVLFAKPMKQFVDGKPVLIQLMKSYNKRPKSQVGMIIGDVDNKTGKIEWEINMPQKPFNFDLLTLYGAKPCDEVVTETTTIAGAYVTQ